jgi:hypothetical protein
LDWNDFEQIIFALSLTIFTFVYKSKRVAFISPYVYHQVYLSLARHQSRPEITRASLREQN